MDITAKILSSLGLALLVGMAVAKDAIDNGVPQSRQGKIKPPTVHECIE